MRRTTHNWTTCKRTRGFTLAETLVYGVGLIIILGGIVTFLFYLYSWYRTATIPARTDQVGVALVKRITADVRAANTITEATNGALTVVTTSGAYSTTTRYALTYGAITSRVNSGAISTTTPTDVWVSAMNITRLTTSYSTALRIELRLDYVTRAGTTANAYSDLAILRQSYQ